MKSVNFCLFLAIIISFESLTPQVEVQILAFCDFKDNAPNMLSKPLERQKEPILLEKDQT